MKTLLVTLVASCLLIIATFSRAEFPTYYMQTGELSIPLLRIIDQNGVESAGKFTTFVTQDTLIRLLLPATFSLIDCHHSQFSPLPLSLLLYCLPTAQFPSQQ